MNGQKYSPDMIMTDQPAGCENAGCNLNAGPAIIKWHLYQQLDMKCTFVSRHLEASSGVLVLDRVKFEYI